MIRATLQSALCLCLSPLLIAQQIPCSGPSPASRSAVKSATNHALTVPRDTKIELVTLESVSSANAHEGQIVRLAVKSDVIVRGSVLIRSGTLATGVVTHVRRSLPGKREGRVSIKPVNLMLPDNSRIELREYFPSGGDEVCEGTASCMALDVVIALLIVPAAIAQLTMAVVPRRHTLEAQNDQIIAAYSSIWASTTKKAHIHRAPTNSVQGLPAKSAIDSVYPEFNQRRPVPSAPVALQQPFSPYEVEP